MEFDAVSLARSLIAGPKPQGKLMALDDDAREAYKQSIRSKKATDRH